MPGCGDLWKLQPRSNFFSRTVKKTSCFCALPNGGYSTRALTVVQGDPGAQKTMRNTQAIRRIGIALLAAAPLFGAGSIVVTPSNESVGIGASRQMTATVTGLANAAVKWSVVGAGSIDANGLYTAPAAMPASTYVSVLAVSMMDSTFPVPPASISKRLARR